MGRSLRGVRPSTYHARSRNDPPALSMPPDAPSAPAPVAWFQDGLSSPPGWGIFFGPPHCTSNALLRSLLIRCESGELHFRGGTPTLSLCDMASAASTVRLLISSF